MDGAGAGGAASERRKQLTAAEAVNHKRQLAQVVERELAPGSVEHTPPGRGTCSP